MSLILYLVMSLTLALMLSEYILFNFHLFLKNSGKFVFSFTVKLLNDYATFNEHLSSSQECFSEVENKSFRKSRTKEELLFRKSRTKEISKKIILFFFLERNATKTNFRGGKAFKLAESRK